MTEQRIAMKLIIQKFIKEESANLLSLSAIQAFNAIFPLIVFPFALHKVGSEKFSEIIWTESLALVCLTLVLYSFEIEGARKLIGIKSSSSTTERAKLFYLVFWTRSLILTALFTFTLIASLIFSPNLITILIYWTLFIFGHILHSAWFFQSLACNSFVALTTIISRVACILLIYYSITTESDYLKVPLLIGLSYFFSGLLSFIYANYAFRMRPTRITIREIFDSMIDGRHICAANMSILLFRGLNAILLKALSTDSAVSVYSLAEKVVKCVQAVARPLNQLMYPKLMRELQVNDIPISQFKKIIWRHTLPQFALLFILTIIIFLLSYFYRNEKILGFDSEVFELFGIMAASTFFGVANFMFGTGGLGALYKDSLYSRIILITGAITFPSAVVLIEFMSGIGAALAYVLGEVVLFIGIMRGLNYKLI